MRVLASELRQVFSSAVQSEAVELRGWVHRVRELGGVSFIMIRDRSGVAQAVIEGKVDLTLESVISATGLVVENEKAPGGAELRATNIELIARAERDLPYPVNGDPAKIGLDTILDQRPLSLRNPKLRGL